MKWLLLSMLVSVSVVMADDMPEACDCEDTDGIIGRPASPISFAGANRRARRNSFRRLDGSCDCSDSSTVDDAVGVTSGAGCDPDDEDCQGIIRRPIARTAAATAVVVNSFNSDGDVSCDCEDTNGIVGRPASPVSVAGANRRDRRNSFRRLDGSCDCSSDDTLGRAAAGGVAVKKTSTAVVAGGARARAFNSDGDVSNSDCDCEDTNGIIGRPASPI